MMFKLLYWLNDRRHRLVRNVVQRKNLAYFKKAGARFADINSVQMNGKSYVSIASSSRVQVGRGFILNSGGGYCIDNQPFSRVIVAPGAELFIGDESGMSNISLLCFCKIEIGSHVNIGAGCLIMDSDFHSLDWKKRGDRKQDIADAQKAPVSIGDYVFIGARSIICKGVHIGPRTVIAAGSVVAKDIPADCIAAGNPCKPIRFINDSLAHGAVE